jgi:hypothetical protein
VEWRSSEFRDIGHKQVSSSKLLHLCVSSSKRKRKGQGTIPKNRRELRRALSKTAGAFASPPRQTDRQVVLYLTDNTNFTRLASSCSAMGPH